MPERKITFLSLVIALVVILCTDEGFAQSLAKDIVGAWALVKTNSYGPNPIGMFMFDGNGHFSANLERSDLPKYASNIRTQGTAAEYKATVEGSIGFFGTYSVNGTDLNLHIVGSTFPNWIGTNQKRINLSIIGDELKFTQPSPSQGGPAEDVISQKIK